MLQLREVSASHGEQRVLSEVSLDIQRDDIVALIGPSGTGKSTLLNCITSLHPLDKGSIMLNNAPLLPKKQTIGWMPQNYGLLPWKKVKDNILMGTHIKKQPQNVALVERIIEELGLSDLLRKYPTELSGGQQQRVALARTLVMTPDLFLLDEPFSALDALTREKMQALFLTQWKKQPAPTIIITHDVEEAVFLGNRILLLSGSPSRIVRELTNPSFDIPLSDKKTSEAYYETIRVVREALIDDSKA